MIDSIKNSWQNFADKHPGASKWIREGGLFVIVSNLITVLKYLLLLFLPMAFAGLPKIDFGFPGIDITLFGETFKWNIIGYDTGHNTESNQIPERLISNFPLASENEIPLDWKVNTFPQNHGYHVCTEIRKSSMLRIVTNDIPLTVSGLR